MEICNSLKLILTCQLPIKVFYSHLIYSSTLQRIHVCFGRDCRLVYVSSMLMSSWVNVRLLFGRKVPFSRVYRWHWHFACAWCPTAVWPLLRCDSSSKVTVHFAVFSANILAFELCIYLHIFFRQLCLLAGVLAGMLACLLRS